MSFTPELYRHFILHTNARCIKLLSVTLYQAYAGFKFQCIDRTGHTSVVVTLKEETHIEREEATGAVNLEILFDAAQVDVFSEELISMGIRKTEKAVLEGSN